MSRLILAKRLGVASALALSAFVGGKEGLRLVTYLDYGGVPTACFGETHGIKVGMSFTPAQCQEMLEGRLAEVMRGVERCTRPGLPSNVLAAYTSFAYNLGTAKFCGSTMAHMARAGLHQQSCAQFDRWTYIGPRDCREPKNLCNGIVIRRKEERALCEGHYG